MPNSTINLILNVSGAVRGARALRQSLRNVDRTARTTQGSVSGISRALAAVGIGLSIRQLKVYSDSWLFASNRIRLTTESTEELIAVQNRLFESAQRVRAEYFTVADLYSRIARNANELGLTQKELIQITEDIGKTIAISGVSARTASAAMIQLGQAFASGVLRGDELRSVMEQLPALAREMAKGMGLTVGQLRKMGLEGKLTADVVVEAIQKQSSSIGEAFGQVLPTLDQSIQVFDNSLTRVVGLAGQASGITEMLTNSIMGLGSAMDQMDVEGSPAVATLRNMTSAISDLWDIHGDLISRMGVLTGTVVVLKVTLIGLNTVLRITKKLLLATFFNVPGLITVAIASLFAFRNAVVEINGHSFMLRDTYSVIWGDMVDIVANAYDEMLTLNDDFLKDLIPSWAVIKDTLYGTVNDIIAIFDSAGTSWTFWLDRMQIDMKDFGNKMDVWIKRIGVGTSMLQRFLGFDIFNPEQNKMLKEQVTEARKALEEAKQTRDDFGLLREPLIQVLANNAWEEIADNLNTDYLEELFAKSGEKSAERFWNNVTNTFQREMQKAKEEIDLDRAFGIEETDRMSDENLKSFMKLLDVIDPITKAKREMAAAEELLRQATKMGNATLEESLDLMDLVQQKYGAAADPVKHLIDQLKWELEIVGLSNTEREIQIEKMNELNSLRQKGAKVTEELADKVEDYIRRIINAREEAAIKEERIDEMNRIAQDNLLDRLQRTEAMFTRIRGPQEDFIDNMEVLNELYDTGQITLAEFNQEFRNQRIAFLSGQRDMVSGARVAFEKYIDYATNAARATEDAFTNAFTVIEDTLTAVFARGEFTLRTFLQSIHEEIVRSLVQLKITGPLAEFVNSKAFGSGINLPFGGGRHAGGDIQPGFTYRVERGETITPTVPSTVTPSGGSRGDISIQTVNVVLPNARNAGDIRKNQHQIASEFKNILGLVKREN